MKEGKEVPLIIFIVVLLLFIAGKAVMGNMNRKVENISVSMPDLPDI